MRKIILLIGIIFMLYLNQIDIKGENTRNIHVIYSDLSVEKDQEFMITFNFENVELYYSIQLVIELGDYFEVVGSTPCELLINSFFKDDEVYVNTVEDNVIRFVGFKKSNDYSSTFNNIVQITLRSKINCQDVRNYLQNVKIGLFNEKYQTIPVNLITSEGIKVEWIVEKYEVELGNDLPNFSYDISISNRKDNEYMIKIITDKIDVNKIGPQVVTVYVYDFTNSSCVILTKAINILDLEKPIITGQKEVVINDIDLSIDCLDNYSVSDNYDINPEIKVCYYQQNGDVLPSKESFFEYLKTNTIGTIKVISIDSSKNESNEFYQTIKINDTTPPNILVDKIIEIKDVEIDSFDLLNYIEVYDVYDANPLIYYLINDLEVIDVKEELLTSYNINVVIYSKDCFHNQSSKVDVNIKLIDTTPPKLEKSSDLIINDTEFTDIESMVIDVIKTSDNFTLPLETKYEYMYEDNNISKEEFNDLLFQSKRLKLLVKVIDQALNESNLVIIETELIDTTSPNVVIKNIEENKKYLNISTVEYEVNDNFKNDVNVEVFLDGEIYQNTPINLIGKHTLVITAVDSSGNQTTKTVNFEIIKNNLIGCGLDTECYTDNYKTILYVAFGILMVSVLVFMTKLIINKNKTKLH